MSFDLQSPTVPAARLRQLEQASRNPPDPEGRYVLYWMTAFRRTRWNWSLDYAVDVANRLAKPLLVLEAVRAGYPWASDRLHAFVVAGMRDNARAVAQTKAHFLGYVEPLAGAGSGLLEALAAHSALVVTDDCPTFFLPRMQAAAGQAIDRPLVAVDSNGLLPLRSTDKTWSRAHDFRRFLQRTLPEHLLEMPSRTPLDQLETDHDDRTARSIDDIAARWPSAFCVDQDDRELRQGIANLPIDHSVTPTGLPGGPVAARERLAGFISNNLGRYLDGRLDLEDPSTSGLSPYLHFGHIAAAEVFAAIADRESWTPLDTSDTATGARSGWWGMSEAADAFLDQLVTWRELGFNRSAREEDAMDPTSLPNWAQETIVAHAADPRPYQYTLEQFEDAATHDELWNAAQRELTSDGHMHNYLRMLWGKKIYEWSKTAQSAIDVMIHLNDKYALDGRDPNSYAGIFWCLGRYDRAWGPERPIYGKLRYMTSEGARRKLRLGTYLKRYGPEPGLVSAGDADS